VPSVLKPRRDESLVLHWLLFLGWVSEGLGESLCKRLGKVIKQFGLNIEQRFGERIGESLSERIRFGESLGRVWGEVK
jgi:hypothetical protein